MEIILFGHHITEPIWLSQITVVFLGHHIPKTNQALLVKNSISRSLPYIDPTDRQIKFQISSECIYSSCTTLSANHCFVGFENNIFCKILPACGLSLFSELTRNWKSFFWENHLCPASKKFRWLVCHLDIATLL